MIIYFFNCVKPAINYIPSFADFKYSNCDTSMSAIDPKSKST